MHINTPNKGGKRPILWRLYGNNIIQRNRKISQVLELEELITLLKYRYQPNQSIDLMQSLLRCQSYFLQN